jgi:transposase InsO family protein
VQRPVNGVQLLGDISTGVFRLFLPAQFRQAAIKSLHDVHHPGVRATCRLVSAAFCWPHMKKQTAAATRSCLGCQRGKTHRHVHLQPEHIPVPHRRFAHLHVDLVGPLPHSAGMTYMFTMVDRTTRWPEVVPLASITAADCAQALLTGWAQRFGVPSAITSDRGPQFTSAVWAALCSLLNITRSTTTAYHPQSNGIVERFHRRLKDALRARAARPDWTKHLPWVLLGIRTAWRDESNFSPADAVYGSQPLLPGQFLDSPENPSPSFNADFQDILAGRPPTGTAHHSSPEPADLPEDLLLARYVLVRRDGHQPPLSPAYNGPYLVLERSLRISNLRSVDRTDNVSTLRLKPCHTPPDAQVEAAKPPRRGRPPKNRPPTTPPAPPTPPPTPIPAPLPGHAPNRKRVTFRCPAVSMPPPPRFHPSGHPARTTARPASYAV